MEQETQPEHKFVQLKEQELMIGNQLTPQQYAELILGWLVQGKTIQAKHCYMRATQRYQNEPLLKQIWTFGEHIQKQNFPLALSQCKDLVLEDPSLQPYVETIKKRLMAQQIKLVANTYTSLHADKFAKLIGSANEQEVAEFLRRSQWTVDNESFIVPARNDQLAQIIAELMDSKFGLEYSSEADTKTDEAFPLGQKELANLGSLINSSLFFDSMNASSASATSANSGGNTV